MFGGQYSLSRLFLEAGGTIIARLASERIKITNDRRQVIGDVYDPGHGRRLQIRDTRQRIIGYIERDGTVTDSRRVRVGKIGELLGGD